MDDNDAATGMLGLGGKSPGSYNNTPRPSTVAEDIESMCLQRLEVLARGINENESSSAALAMDRSQMMSEVERLERVLFSLRTEPAPKAPSPPWVGGMLGPTQQAEPPAGYGR